MRLALLTAGLFIASLATMAVLGAGVAQAAGLTVTDLNNGATPTSLANTLAGVGVDISNVTYTGDNRAAGTFSGGSSSIGFDSGVVLDSGKVQTVSGDSPCSRGVEGPNNCYEATGGNPGGPGGESNSTGFGTPGDADLTTLSGFSTFDASVLEFDFVPNSPTITFSYVFSSEEYSDFANTQFNDVFGFFVNGTNCALVPGTTDPVSVNTINNGNDTGGDATPHHPELFRDNVRPAGPTLDTQMDGLTVELTCTAAVNPGVTNHMKLAIADASDPSLDSAVFLQAGSLVSDPAITASGTTVHATEGRSFTGPVATFRDPDTTATADQYSATIDWGDGATTSGTITGSGGDFTVTGTHTYAEQGTFTIKVTIADTDTSENSATATSSAVVADAALHATGVNHTQLSKSFKGEVATFTDDDPGGKLSDYTATINWGDGKTSSGTIGVASGRFTVRGSHLYSRTGTFHITVTIKDEGGSTATATSTITIRVVHGTARLSGVPAQCVRSAVALQVIGRRVASVTWSVNGGRIAGRTVKKGSRYSATIASSPGARRVTANVKFVAASHTRARTLRATVTGCSAPTFTG